MTHSDQPKFVQGDLVHITCPSATHWHDKNARVACQLPNGKYRLQQVNPHYLSGGPTGGSQYAYADFPECDLHLVIQRRNEDIVRGFENSSVGGSPGIRIRESQVQQENSRLKSELLEAEDGIAQISALFAQRAQLKMELKQVEKDINRWMELRWHSCDKTQSVLRDGHDR